MVNNGKSVYPPHLIECKRQQYGGVMRRIIYNPDFSLFLLGAAFTVASAALSGYFGWLRAAGTIAPVQIASAIICGGIALALAMFITRRERLRYEGIKRNAAYRSAGFAVWILLIANVTTDFMATQALFDLTSTRADNMNTEAINARNTVKNLQGRIDNLKAEAAFKTTWDSPAAFTARITQQKQITENGRNIWQRSKQCTNTTVASSQAVCVEIATLEANRENAKRRQVILAEIASLEKQLIEAKKVVRANKKEANAASTPVDNLTSMVLNALDPSKDAKKWGQNYFIAFLTLVFSAAIYFISKEQGRRLGPMPEYEAFDLASYHSEYEEPLQLPAPDGHQAAPIERPPIPLKAVDRPAPQPGVPAYEQPVQDSLSHLEQLAARLAKRNDESLH